MPKVWIGYDIGHGEYYMMDEPPVKHLEHLTVPVEMNGSLHRQIRAAEKKMSKMQTLLEKFFYEAHEHSDTVRRVR